MKKVHFIAIGSDSMHNLAIALNKKETTKVTGSDDKISENTISRLKQHKLLPEKLGWFPDKIEKGLNAVIVGDSVTEDNPELIRATELSLKIYSIPEYLLLQTRSKTRIVVSGSHGKTTTTAMILFVLKKNKIDTDYFITTHLDGFENRIKLTYEARIAVFEGEENPTSPVNQIPKFHLYKPHIAIITGIEWEQNSSFTGYENYVEQFAKFPGLMETQGRLIYFEEDVNLKIIATKLRRDIVAFPYNKPDYEIVNGITYLNTKKSKIPIKIFGERNLQYIEAARFACRQIGIYDDQFYAAISEFPGIPYKLEKIIETEKAIAFVDSAQNPWKIKTAIQAVKNQFPDKKLIACFELNASDYLNNEFLPIYTDCLKQADLAFIYFKPEVVQVDQSENISPEQIKFAFGNKKNFEIYTDTLTLQKKLKSLNYTNSTLLFMTAGNFSGINLIEFSQDLLK